MGRYQAFVNARYITVGQHIIVQLIRFPAVGVDVAGENAASAQARKSLMKTANAAEQIDEPEFLHLHSMMN